MCACIHLYIYIYIHIKQEARWTLNNQITRRLSLISNIVVTHGTTMTDYKAFYLDYVPEEKIIRVQKQHFYPIKTRVDPCFALLCKYSLDTSMCCCHQAAEAFLLSTKDLVGENAIVSIWAGAPHPILKQRTEANISSTLSAAASPSVMRGRLLKNDSSRACRSLVLCYLFS